MTVREREKGNDSPVTVSAEKILIVKPSSLGDIVHSLPFLNAIKSCFPKAEIHWVVARGLEGLLEGHPMVDEIIIIDKDKWKKPGRLIETVNEIAGLLREMRRRRYDLVIDLQGLFRSGVISMATGAHVRIGFSEAREGSWLFYTRKVEGGREIHAVDRYLKIADALGCDTSEVIFPFPLMKNDDVKLKETRTAPKSYVVIVPGARWETKKWPAERFGEIASMLPLKSLVIGSRADREIAAEVVEASGGKAVSLAGETTLRELIKIMSSAKLVISNDSGPMHIAAGFNVPVVAIFGPTSPARTGPYGKAHVVIKSDAACSPCFKKRCGDLICMRRITVDMVYESVLCRLNQP
jgi:heptosyltransferase-1